MPDRPIREIIEGQHLVVANAEISVSAAAQLMQQHHVGDARRRRDDARPAHHFAQPPVRARTAPHVRGQFPACPGGRERPRSRHGVGARCARPGPQAVHRRPRDAQPHRGNSGLDFGKPRKLGSDAISFAERRVNLNMLRMAIQGLEMEKATLTATQHAMTMGMPKKDP